MKETYVNKEKGKGIKKVVALEPYLVVYVDGAGNEERRLVLRAPKESTDPKTAADVGVYIIQERIAGVSVAKMANKWFADSLNEIVAPPVKAKTRARATNSVSSV